MHLSVQIAPKNPRGLLLANPVMTSSGTFGYGTEYGDLVDVQKLGAIVCKGTTLEPREGNPQPRMTETASGVLNSIGLQNIGVQALITEKAPLWAGWKVPVIVNIAGNTIEEYGQIAERLNSVKGVSGLEVNISCPNVKSGGMQFGAEPDMARRVTQAVRAATSLPVIVKLTPCTNQITEVARAVAAAGADALTVANTLRGIAIDIYQRKPVLSNITGGLSGPAIKPVALLMVYEVAGAVKIPIIGSGGIYKSKDAIEFIMAGASAIQVGSASFANPRASLNVLEGIEEFLQRENINKIADLIGIARQEKISFKPSYPNKDFR